LEFGGIFNAVDWPIQEGVISKKS